MSAVIGYVMEWGLCETGPVASVGNHQVCTQCAYEKSKWAWLRFHEKDPQRYLDEDCQAVTSGAFRCEVCGKEVASADFLERVFGGAT